MSNDISNIGHLFISLRKNLNLSREKFCSGVCSSKYLYLIEKGERTPSVQIIEAFSYKVGIDLYDYFQYLDFDEPIKVKNMIDQMDNMMVSRDFDGLRRMTDVIQQMKDFSTPPLCYQIDLNIAWLLANVDLNYEKAKKIMLSTLAQMGYPVLDDSIDYGLMYRPVMRGYGLIAVCEVRGGFVSEGLDRMAKVYRLLEMRKRMRSITHTYLSMGINYAYTLIINGDYEESIRISKALISYQVEANILDRLYITYFTLGHALYLTGERDESRKWLVKCNALTFAMDIKNNEASFSEYESMQWALNEINNKLTN